ncbi:MAG: hypothetical protein ACI4TL_00910, partial [Candidatus Cryptobacteroides sp.]
VPMAQAVATTIYRKVNENHNTGSGTSAFLKSKVKDLEKMLWGGSLMLVVDHIINGELIWRFPFFTALTEVDGPAIFLKELLTVGLPMSLVLTFCWLGVNLLKARKLSKA